jgi:hypothetical protein
VICTDKTGTLTQNRMAVRAIFSRGQLFQWPANPTAEANPFLYLICRLCNNASLEGEKTSGDPLEVALLQAAAGWQGIACQFGHALSRGSPCTGVAQKAHVTSLMDHEEVFERVAVLRATGICLLFCRVFRPLHGPFSPIMNKREQGAEASVGDVVSIAVKSSAVRAGSRSWSAKA